MALADVEVDADDDAEDGEGAKDATDDGTCRRPGSDLQLFFWRHKGEKRNRKKEKL